MAGLSQRRSAALALRRLVQRATSAGRHTSQLPSSPFSRQLHFPSLLPGAAHSQSACGQLSLGQLENVENSSPFLLANDVQDATPPAKLINHVRAYHAGVAAPGLSRARWGPPRGELGPSRVSWLGRLGDGQVSLPGVASKFSGNWQASRAMSGGPPLDEDLTEGPDGAEGADDWEDKDKLQFDNATLLQLWNIVRRIPEERQMLMPTVATWKGEPGNELTKDLALALARRLKQRRRYKHALELCEWIVNGSGWPPNALDYKAYIDACCRVNRLKKAETIVSSMPEEFRQEEVLAGILSYYARKGQTTKLEQRIQQAREEGIPPTTMTHNARLQAYGRRGLVEKMPEVVQDMRNEGLQLNKQSYNILIDRYGKAGLYDDMRRMFEEMQAAGLEPDAVTYNTLAFNYFGGDKLEAAAEIEAACRAHTGPSLSLYLTLMWAYSRRGMVDKMEAVFEEMKSTGKPLFRQIWMARIHGYGRAGNPEKAKEIFEEMASGAHMPVTMSYNCLLSAYTLNGRMAQAEELLQEMHANHKVPDAVSYQYMMTGHMAAGDWEAAAKLFHYVAVMKMRSSLRPTLKVFLDLVEGFTQKGEINRVDDLMFDAGRMYKLDAQLFNTWLNAHVSYRQKVAAEGTVTPGEAPTAEDEQSTEVASEDAAAQAAAGESAQQDGNETAGATAKAPKDIDARVLRILKKMQRVKYSPTDRTMDLITQLGAKDLATSFGWGQAQDRTRKGAEEAVSAGGEGEPLASGEETGEGAPLAEGGEERRAGEDEVRLAALGAVEEEAGVKQNQPA